MRVTAAARAAHELRRIQGQVGALVRIRGHEALYPDGQDGARLTRDERDVLLGLMHQIKRAAGALDPGRGA